MPPYDTRFADRLAHLLHRPANFVGRDDRGRRDHNVVAAPAVRAALHGIEQHAALHRALVHAAPRISFRRDKVLSSVLSATNSTAHSRPSPRTSPTQSSFHSFCNSSFRTEADAAGTIGVGGFDQLASMHAIQHGAASGDRHRVSVVGEAVQQRACCRWRWHQPRGAAR